MVKCPKCEYENSDGAVYCMSCAQRLDGKSFNSVFSRTSSQTIGFGTRLAAYFIDVIVLTLGTMVLSIFGLIVIPKLIAGLILWSIGPVYYISMWAYCDGATLGKKLLGIKIVRTDNSPLTIGRAILRYIGYFVSSFLFCLGYFWVIWDRQNQGWHDKMADTLVVQSPGFKRAHTIAARLILAFLILGFLTIGTLGFMFASQLSKFAAKGEFPKNTFVDKVIKAQKEKINIPLKMPSFSIEDLKQKSKKYKTGWKGKIDGIVYSQKDSSVMIDKKIYHAGDYVCGGTIVDISPNKITMRFGSKEKSYGVGSMID